MTHTKEPWLIWRDDEGLYVGKECGVICEIWGLDENTDGNTALIAAAPDMLAALKQAVAFERMGSTLNPIPDFILSARAAIAKASTQIAKA